MTIVLDPTAELNAATRARLDRPASLDRLNVGILDISKPRGDVFLDRLHERLAMQGVPVRRYAKPAMTRPAPLPLCQQIATEIDVVIEGLAD